jgi:hypothetical protein
MTNMVSRTMLVIAGAGLLISQFGIRPQVISWLFMAILFWMVGTRKINGKIKLLIPPAFLVWANMHGMFLLGLVILGVYLGVKSFRAKKLIVSDVLILLASILVTLVNPYGIGLWKEVLGTFFDVSSRVQIIEWKPVWTKLNLFYPLITLLGLTLIYRYKKLINPEWIVLFVGLFLLSVNSLISVPVFGLLALSVLTTCLTLLKTESGRIKFGKHRYNLVAGVFVGIVFALYPVSVYLAIKEANDISEDRFYPKQAVNYIAQNVSTGEIFAPFNWGGYLIWKLPQKKVFVDGRMVHWSGILDYQTGVVNGETDYKDVFSKYSIQTVLWPKKTTKHKFITKIKEDGWVSVYSDSVSEVFEKNPKN